MSRSLPGCVSLSLSLRCRESVHSSSAGNRNSDTIFPGRIGKQPRQLLLSHATRPRLIRDNLVPRGRFLQESSSTVRRYQQRVYLPAHPPSPHPATRTPFLAGEVLFLPTLRDRRLPCSPRLCAHSRKQSSKLFCRSSFLSSTKGRPSRFQNLVNLPCSEKFASHPRLSSPNPFCTPRGKPFLLLLLFGGNTGFFPP